MAGEDEAGATERTTVDRDGFETAVEVPEDAADAPCLVVAALDAEGEVLGAGAAQHD